jgi:hypothetical protein
VSRCSVARRRLRGFIGTTRVTSERAESDRRVTVAPLRVDHSVELRTKTGIGLDYYFIKSLKVAKAGFVVEQSTSLGLSHDQ